jgi:hypothetical protein
MFAKLRVVGGIAEVYSVFVNIDVPILSSFLCDNSNSNANVISRTADTGTCTNTIADAGTWPCTNTIADASSNTITVSLSNTNSNSSTHTGVNTSTYDYNSFVDTVGQQQRNDRLISFYFDIYFGWFECIQFQ